MAERLARFDDRAPRIWRSATGQGRSPSCCRASRIAPSRFSPPPGSIRWRSGCRAIRWPRALLQAFGGPIAAPSANLSGRLSPTTAAHVAESLGDKRGGHSRRRARHPSALNRPSSISAGAGPAAAARRPCGRRDRSLIGPLGSPDAGEGPRAPGMLASHYAPDALAL